MKILILCNKGDEIAQNNFENINNISSVYGYFYLQNMKRYTIDKRLNIQYHIDKLSFAERINENYDHCFVLYNRGVKVLGKNFDNLRKFITGKIFTIAPSSKIINREDILLHYVGKVKSKCFKINWTADKFELFPKQKSVNKIRILVDHKYYGKKDSRIYKGDQTENIIKFLLDYKNNNNKFDIEIIQICTDNDLGYKVINNLEDAAEYNRHKATSFKNIYKIYNTSSIFFVTHEECMGISTLECNMAGCLVIHPKNYIKDCFSKLLTKKEFQPVDDYKKIELNMDEIIQNINHKKIKMRAHRLNYYNSVDKIFSKIIFKNYKKN